MALANLEFLAGEVWPNLAACAARLSAVFDVAYHRLVTDPIETMKDIYTHFGLDWPQTHEACVACYIRHHPKGARGNHEYDAVVFGFSQEQIAEPFRGYCRRLDLVLGRAP